MWSTNYHKYVFIDFGLSKFICFGIGTKILTKFVGTYNFCCPELKKLYHLSGAGYVDLYYNDVYGLNKIIVDVFDCHII
jgi:hypothetical protein